MKSIGRMTPFHTVFGYGATSVDNDDHHRLSFPTIMGAIIYRPLWLRSSWGHGNQILLRHFTVVCRLRPFPPPSSRRDNRLKNHEPSCLLNGSYRAFDPIIYYCFLSNHSTGGTNIIYHYRI